MPKAKPKTELLIFVPSNHISDSDHWSVIEGKQISSKLRLTEMMNKHMFLSNCDLMNLSPAIVI